MDIFFKEDELLDYIVYVDLDTEGVCRKHDFISLFENCEDKNLTWADVYPKGFATLEQFMPFSHPPKEVVETEHLEEDGLYMQRDIGYVQTGREWEQDYADRDWDQRHIEWDEWQQDDDGEDTILWLDEEEIKELKQSAADRRAEGNFPDGISDEALHILDTKYAHIEIEEEEDDDDDE
jgi:hypothetical protein